ncbi:MAG: 4Fe-4S binding protein [Clostridia bacterium]|nr:4Fe-4S binding protein [Clostridia bacterium]
MLLDKHNRIRLAVQGAAALLQNANFKGFFTGKIYEGQLKSVCVPGLNCYSCPGAVGACPIGSLQNALSANKFRLPYYVLGLLVFFGAVLGRLVCGFLCPFGLLQDLLYKLPFPKKIRTFRGDRLLRKLKYAVLIVLVIVLPLCVKLTPFFCKYLCPSGTLSGLLLALSDTSLFRLFGSRFAWKACILGMIVLWSVVICRPFCKYLCPLGAFYAPFNKVAAVKIQVDANKCVNCGACEKACPMNVDPSRTPNHTECIRCGECLHTCPAKALRYEICGRAKKTQLPAEPPEAIR